MADSDLALAIAIAENSDSSQDEDFQLPANAAQLCIFRKLAHPPKRQKKSHCLSEKGSVLQKPRRISEGKENQDRTGRRNRWSHAKFNFADPDLSQVRRPLVARKPSVQNRPRFSSAESCSGELVKGHDKKGETSVDKAQKHTDRSQKVIVDRPSETYWASTGPYLSHHFQKVLDEIPKAFHYPAPESHHPYCDQANARSHASAIDVSDDGSTEQSAFDHHDNHAHKIPEEVMLETLKGSRILQKVEEFLKPQSQMAEMAQPGPSSTKQGTIHHSAQKDGNLLVDTMESDATFSSRDEIISLAEEDDLAIDVIEQKEQWFEPDCVQEENLPTVDCLSSANANRDSQFNALLNLCINSFNDDDVDEVDEFYVDSLGNSLAAEDGSLVVEELISSLMTQNRCRESSVSCDAILQPIIGPLEVSPKSHTEIEINMLLSASRKTCMEAQKSSFELELCSDGKQADSDGKSYGEEIEVCMESKLEQPLECPVCGSCITCLSLEQREVHTNACLDSTYMKEPRADAMASDTDQHTKPDGEIELGDCVQEDCSLDLAPVLKWLETLNLSRYGNVFVREEIDWDTLKCLTDEDLITLGITSFGPRRKILYALQQLEKGRPENVINSMNPAAENKQQLEADTAGKKLITNFFELSPCLSGKGAFGPQTEPVNKEKTGVSISSVVARKRILTELAGIPEWMSIPGTKFLVDAFQHLRADCSHWFLTHFHTDHYQGLTRGFRYGHVYCSHVTAQLVNMRIGVPWERLKSLPLDQTIEIDGVKVTLIDANHCPGSVMILFKLPNGKAVLHTGDFRFSEEMASNAVLQACNIHTVMLDTTYCNPQYDFPKQEVVVQFIIDAIQAEAFNPSTLFLIGTYTIGKERIFFEVAKALQKKIYCSATKLRLLQCMNFPDEDMKWLTTNDRDAHIHVVPLWSIASFKRMNYIVRHNAGRYNSIVSFSPSGWSFGRGKKRTPGRRWRQGTIVRYEIPYSEHCSFKELKGFVKFINPVNIIPSVHNDSAEAADALIALLLNEEEDD